MKARTMAGHLIRRLHQLSNHVFTQHIQAAGFDLTSVQFAAMDAIAAWPGIDQAGVAQRIAYDRATIGGVIDRLVQKGYVARQVSKTDRRAREILLTDLGAQVLDTILPVVTALQSRILAGLDEDERRTFLALAAKAVAVERAEEGCKLPPALDTSP